MFREAAQVGRFAAIRNLKMSGGSICDYATPMISLCQQGKPLAACFGKP